VGIFAHPFLFFCYSYSHSATHTAEFSLIVVISWRSYVGGHIVIRVIYKNGDEDLVTPKFLDILLHINEIEKFQRAGEWVNVASTPLRKQALSSYAGKERRRHSKSVLNSFAMENKPAEKKPTDQPSD